MKKYSAYLFLPLLLCFALCITSCDDDDDSFDGEWNVVAITQEIEGFGILDNSASGTITLNADGTGSRNYSFDFSNPVSEDLLPITVIDDITWTEDGDLLKITTSTGGIEDWDRTENSNTNVVMSRNATISTFLAKLTLTMNK